MKQTEGARRQQVRGQARRQGFTLRKIRRVDPLALDFNTYELWDGEQKVNECGNTLEAVAAYLASAPRLTGAAKAEVVARIAARVKARLAQQGQKKRRKK